MAVLEVDDAYLNQAIRLLMGNRDQLPVQIIASASSVYETVSDWYVGGALGNNSNDGRTLLTPFENYAPLNDRIGSPNVFLQQDTNIHVLGDMPDDGEPLTFLGGIKAGNYLYITQEAPTTLATITLTTANNLVVNASQPTIQASTGGPNIDWTTAGPGGTSLIGKRCRKVSGPGAADVGTLFWLEATALGDDTTAIVGARPQFSVLPATPTNETLTVGDVYEVEDLGVMGSMEIVPSNVDIPLPRYCCVFVSNGRGRAVDSGFAMTTLGNPRSNGGVCAYGCDLNFGRIYGGFTGLYACKWGASSILQCNLFVQDIVEMWACSCIAGTRLSLQGSGQLETYNNPSSRSELQLAYSAVNMRMFHSMSFAQWSGRAINVASGRARFDQRPWGASTNANTYGLLVGSGGRASYTQLPTLAGTIGYDMDIGGVTNLWAAAPYINPANNACLVVSA